MIKGVVRFWFNYTWFLKNSKEHMILNQPTFFYKIKALVQSLYKGILFCYQIIANDYIMKEFEHHKHYELVDNEATIITFLIENKYIKSVDEYNDFIDMLQITYKLEE